MGYAAHESFVAPARARAEWWRTASGIAMAVIAGLALYQLGLAFLGLLFGPDVMREVWDEATFDGTAIGTPRGTLFVLCTFAFFGTGLAMALQAMHARALMTLVGLPAAALSDFVRVAGATTLLYGAVLLFLPQGYETLRNPGMSAQLWFALLPLSLLAVAVQAGTEELFFRGYLQQQIAARMPGWPAWMLVPALLFGAMHWSPGTAGENAGLYVAWGVAFGLAAADLTARTGTLGAALGLHLANNAFAVLGTALAGPVSGLALWLVPLRPDAPELAAAMPVELMMLFVAWLAARVALRV